MVVFWLGYDGTFGDVLGSSPGCAAANSSAKRSSRSASKLSPPSEESHATSLTSNCLHSFSDAFKGSREILAVLCASQEKPRLRSEHS